MESIVYDFSQKGDEELEKSYDFSLNKEYMGRSREIYRKDYIKLLKSIKKFKNKKKIYDFLINIDDIKVLEDAVSIFSESWINEDDEIIEWLKNNLISITTSLLYGISRANSRNKENKKKMQEMYSNKENLKKMLFKSGTVKGHLVTYFASCIENSAYLSNPEILDILSHGEYIEYEEDTIKGILENKKIDNVYLLKKYFSIKGENKQHFYYYINKIFETFDNVDIIKEEIEIFVSICKRAISQHIAPYYLDMYDLPFFKDEKIRRYIAKIFLTYVNIRDNYIFSDYIKPIIEVLEDEKLRNNEELLAILSNNAGSYHCQLLINCFKDEKVSQNKELIELIKKMPNFYTLEQLMLAYETKKIGSNIEILKKVASYSPDVDLMKSEREKYGKSESEKERIKMLELSRKKH